jgi:predicted nucleotidyltransferase
MMAAYAGKSLDQVFPYRGNLEWLHKGLILLVNHGSHAYGLNTPESDLDIKGIAVPPREYFLGFAATFEQAESKEPDMVVFDVRKFFKLAAECNPNIIEVLWGHFDDVRYNTPCGQMLLQSRELFLSKKARHTFSGYAMAQLKRIKTHYRWLKTPPVEPPTRKEFGLPEHTVIPADQLAAAQSAITKKLGSWNLDDMSGLEPADRIRLQNLMAEMLTEIEITKDQQYLAAARSIGYDENFLRLLDLERQYKSRKVEWEQYQNWKATRNVKRAALEAKSGYDTKHAMHLVRLMRMCREILETGQVVVRRPDRDELLAVRGGAWSYEQLIEWAIAEDAKLDDVYQKSPLRHHPDRAALDKLCMRIVEQSLS